MVFRQSCDQEHDYQQSLLLFMWRLASKDIRRRPSQVSLVLRTLITIHREIFANDDDGQTYVPMIPYRFTVFTGKRRGAGTTRNFTENSY
jgi:hypothetical protein